MRVFSVVPLAVSVFLCGCLEHQVRTTVSEDGSCDRVILVPADSLVVPDSPFPLHTGAGWDTLWRPGKGGKGIVLTLSKHYDHYEDLAAEYSTPSDTTKLHIDVLVDRSFRWFYTYYRYREVFHRLTPFTRIPPSAVLSGEEIDLYARGERNTVLNQKAEMWVARSLFQILMDTLKVGMASDPVAVTLLEEKHDSLFGSMVEVGADSTLRDFGAVMAEQTHSRVDPAKFFSGSKITGAGLAAFVELVGNVVGIPPTTLLEESARAAWRAWNNAVERSARMQGVFVISVELPGLIVETNSQFSEEHVLTWKFDGEQYSMTDYVLEAESRVENLWAFGVTITVALVLGGIVLYGRRTS